MWNPNVYWAKPTDCRSWYCHYIVIIQSLSLSCYLPSMDVGYIITGKPDFFKKNIASLTAPQIMCEVVVVKWKPHLKHIESKLHLPKSKSCRGLNYESREQFGLPPPVVSFFQGTEIFRSFNRHSLPSFNWPSYAVYFCIFNPHVAGFVSVTFNPPPMKVKPLFCLWVTWFCNCHGGWSFCYYKQELHWWSDPNVSWSRIIQN